MFLSQAFKMIRPTLSKRDRKRKKEEQEKLLEQFDEIEVSAWIYMMQVNFLFVSRGPFSVPNTRKKLEPNNNKAANRSFFWSRSLHLKIGR